VRVKLRPLPHRPLVPSLETRLITIHLNGEAREVPHGLTLAELIEWLKLPADRTAVERNLEVVPKTRWGETPIQANDRLELVHLVGGGLPNALTEACSAPQPAGAGCRFNP
jgi:thiamine biosynthesis protein ThiS